MKKAAAAWLAAVVTVSFMLTFVPGALNKGFDFMFQNYYALSESILPSDGSEPTPEVAEAITNDLGNWAEDTLDWLKTESQKVLEELEGVTE